MNDYLNEIKTILSKVDDYNINEYYSESQFPTNAWKYIMQNVISPLELNFQSKIDGVVLAKIFEAIGYSSQDGGLNFAIGAHTLASAIPLCIYGSDSQKEKYLSQMLCGELICANAITETEAGSDIFSMNSEGIKNNNHYSLNGTKTFCSNVKEASLALVYVVTDKEKGVHGGISTFILEKSQFNVGQTYSKMGLRTCSIGELILNNVVISDKQLLGKEGSGLGIFTTAMEWERIGLSAIYIGCMQRLFEQTLDYTKTRRQGGKTIGKYQAISHKIAEIKTLITTCRHLVYGSASKLGKDRTVSEDASMCKWYISETYVKVCEYVMQIHGGNGYMEEYGIERHLRDAHASTIYSGTTEIQKNIIAKWNGL
jgi:alkylation response protein AidB-like acyl-CoA dehydrogenase